MAVTYEQISTTGLLEISSNEDSFPSMWGWMSRRFNDFAGEICNMVVDNSSIISGSGYQDGVYLNVALFRTASTQTGGVNCFATVTITGGGVSNVEITTKGNGFKVGDFLTCPDLSQIGGTGSGFQIPILSADPSVGLVKGSEQRSNTSMYPVGLDIGVERFDSYPFGVFVNRTSSNDRYNVDDYYSSGQSAGLNGYGFFNEQPTAASNYGYGWTDGEGDGFWIWVAYCTEPGNRFFLTGDNTDDYFWGVAEAVQDPADGPWPDRTVVSPWCLMQGSPPQGNYSLPFGSVSNSTAYVGAQKTKLAYPQDPGILFNGFDVRGRSYLTGRLPDRIYTHSDTAKLFGFVYQDGGTSYRRLTSLLYVRMN